MTDIGIVGQGFVGSTMRECLKSHHTVHTYDKFVSEKSTVENLFNLVYSARIIFVCVPTPMKMSTGECDTSIVEEVVEDLAQASRLQSKYQNGHIVVIRSTVPPGTTERLNRKYDDIEVCFQPEFLREASPIEDFKNQNRIVLGGDLGKKLINKLDPLTEISLVYREVFPKIPILTTNATTAEMVKYITNCYLSTKVVFANMVYDMCNSLNIDYDTTIRISKYDNRLGESHWQVPGPDGDRCFGGHCLPKDLSSLIYEMEKQNIKCDPLKSVKSYNEEVRNNKDWLEMEGRAVTKE